MLYIPKYISFLFRERERIIKAELLGIRSRDSEYEGNLVKLWKRGILLI